MINTAGPCLQEVERHQETQVEKVVPAASRYYCPNPQCSRMLKRRGNARKLTCPSCSAVVSRRCTNAGPIRLLFLLLTASLQSRDAVACPGTTDALHV